MRELSRWRARRCPGRVATTRGKSSRRAGGERRATRLTPVLPVYACTCVRSPYAANGSRCVLCASSANSSYVRPPSTPPARARHYRYVTAAASATAPFASCVRVAVSLCNCANFHNHCQRVASARGNGTRAACACVLFRVVCSTKTRPEHKLRFPFGCTRIGFTFSRHLSLYVAAIFSVLSQSSSNRLVRAY